MAVSPEQKYIAELVGQLDKPDKAEAAKQSLIEMGSAAVPMLVRATTYIIVPKIRAQVAEILGEIGDKSANEALQQLIEQDPETVVKEAAQKAKQRIENSNQ